MVYRCGVSILFFYTYFYLFLIKYFRTIKINYFIVLLFLSSLLSNIYIDYIDGKNFSFFMFFTRLWEFLIGSLCYHFVKRSYYKKDWIIFILFFYSCLFCLTVLIMKYTILFAVLFAFSILCFNSRNFYISYLFENKFLVFLGLYLMRFIYGIGQFFHCLNTIYLEIKLQDNLVLILCSIVLAFLTTKYFENKFRYSINKNYTLASIIFIFFLVITINPQISLFKKRTFDEKILNISKSIGSNYRCSKNNYFIYGQSKACLINSDS